MASSIRWRDADPGEQKHYRPGVTNWTRVHVLRPGEPERTWCGLAVPAYPYTEDRDEQIPTDAPRCTRCAPRAEARYHVFHRTWWRRNAAYPNGLEPHAGRKHTLARYVATEAEARRLCEEWCATHAPGPLSDKAEYEQEAR